MLTLAALLLPAATAAAADNTLYWLGSKLPNGATYADGGGDPMKYFVDETQSSPGGIPVANMEQEVRDAYQRWQDVPCAYIGFQFQGAITNPANLGTHADTQNVMGSFVISNTDPRYDDDLGGGVAVGVALTYASNGVIRGCDTEFNAYDYHFGDTLPATVMDFPSLANHENGHCLGLDHDPNDLTSVMYPTVNDGDVRRGLDAHDQDNVCQLYPVTGALGSPCSSTSCGSDLSCIQDPVNGGNFCSHGCTPTDPNSCAAGFGCRSSTAITGQGAACFPGTGDLSPNVGAGCTQNADCQGASALCFPVAQGWPDGYCSETCGTTQACPQGDVCAQLDQSANTFCTQGCTTYQRTCRSGYSCAAYDDLGDGFCYPACASDADCGTWKCLPDHVCAPPGNGSAAVGHACVSRTDCPTGDFCVPAANPDGTATGWTGGYCVAPCGGGQNAARPCALGSACVLTGADGQALCLQACRDNADCRSGYTCGVKTTGASTVAKVCLPFCGSDQDCPVGEQCSAGSCIDPYAVDAGQSCVLCGDGGVPTMSGSGSSTSGTTGGDTPATPGGCGCGAGGPGGPWALLGLLAAALALRGRRRS